MSLKSVKCKNCENS